MAKKISGNLAPRWVLHLYIYSDTTIVLWYNIGAFNQTRKAKHYYISNSREKILEHTEKNKTKTNIE